MTNLPSEVGVLELRKSTHAYYDRKQKTFQLLLLVKNKRF